MARLPERDAYNEPESHAVAVNHANPDADRITYAIPDKYIKPLIDAIRDASLRAFADGYESGFQSGLWHARRDPSADLDRDIPTSG